MHGLAANPARAFVTGTCPAKAKGWLCGARAGALCFSVCFGWQIRRRSRGTRRRKTCTSVTASRTALGRALGRHKARPGVGGGSFSQLTCIHCRGQWLYSARDDGVLGAALPLSPPYFVRCWRWQWAMSERINTLDAYRAHPSPGVYDYCAATTTATTRPNNAS